MEKRIWHTLFIAATCLLVALPALAHHPDTVYIENDNVFELMGLEKLTILDVRMMQDYAKSDSKIKGAIRINLRDLKKWVNSQPKGSTIVVYCNSTSESHSTSIAFKLQNLGMKKVYYLKGGWEGWTKAGYPTEKK